MLIEKYCEDESWRAGYREACFDLCTGNLDKDKAFELQREDEDCEDCCGECDVYDIAYKHGYSDGLEDGYDEAFEDMRYDNEDYEYPTEIPIDCTNINTIEMIKDDLRDMLFHELNISEIESATKIRLWDIISELNSVEKSIAGDQVLDYFRESKF